MIPEPWEFVLLALAVYRVFKLIAEDTILDRPRAWVLKRLSDTWDLFLQCPWCLGWWLSLAWWGAWLIAGDWALLAATPWALSAVVALVTLRDEPA